MLISILWSLSVGWSMSGWGKLWKLRRWTRCTRSNSEEPVIKRCFCPWSSSLRYATAGKSCWGAMAMTIMSTSTGIPCANASHLGFSFKHDNVFHGKKLFGCPEYCSCFWPSLCSNVFDHHQAIFSRPGSPWRKRAQHRWNGHALFPYVHTIWYVCMYVSIYLSIYLCMYVGR